MANTAYSRNNRVQALLQVSPSGKKTPCQLGYTVNYWEPEVSLAVNHSHSNTHSQPGKCDLQTKKLSSMTSSQPAANANESEEFACACVDGAPPPSPRLSRRRSLVDCQQVEEWGELCVDVTLETRLFLSGGFTCRYKESVCLRFRCFGWVVGQWRSLFRVSNGEQFGSCFLTFEKQINVGIGRMYRVRERRLDFNAALLVRLILEWVLISSVNLQRVCSLYQGKHLWFTMIREFSYFVGSQSVCRDILHISLQSRIKL